MSRNEGEALTGAQGFRVMQMVAGNPNPFRTPCSVHEILGPLRGPIATQGLLPQGVWLRRHRGRVMPSLRPARCLGLWLSARRSGAFVGAGLGSRNEGKALTGAQDYRVMQWWQGTQIHSGPLAVSMRSWGRCAAQSRHKACSHKVSGCADTEAEWCRAWPAGAVVGAWLASEPGAAGQYTCGVSAGLFAGKSGRRTAAPTGLSQAQKKTSGDVFFLDLVEPGGFEPPSASTPLSVLHA